jgi:hypothetical protein
MSGINNQAGNQLRVVVDKDILDHKIAKSDLLVYLAGRFVDVINTRTDAGLADSGTSFKPYKPRYSWARNEDGTLKSDSTGKRVNVQIRGPNDVVTMRSLSDIDLDTDRMRGSLAIMPAHLDPDASLVTIKQTGGRGGVGHVLRARTSADAGRQHITIHDHEYRAVLADIRLECVAAFVKRRRRGLLTKRMAQAHAAARRQIARSRRKAKMAQLTAVQRHEAQLAKLRRMGIVVEAEQTRATRGFGSAKDQYKEMRRQQRIAKAKKKKR